MTNDELHKCVIAFGQKEELRDGGVGNLIIVRLAAQSQERRKHIDVVPATRSDDQYFVENDDAFSSNLTDVCAFFYLVVESLSSARFFIVRGTILFIFFVLIVRLLTAISQ